MEGKLSIGLLSPSSISFNDNAMVKNFCPKKFQSLKLFKDLPPTWRSSLIIEPCSTSCEEYHQFWLHILSQQNKRYWSFSRLLTCKSWSWGLVAFIITLMWCRESIFVEKSTIDFPNFILFFNAKFPIFPIFSILSFLFSYLFEQPCRWTPCSTYAVGMGSNPVEALHFFWA